MGEVKKDEEKREYICTRVLRRGKRGGRKETKRMPSRFRTQQGNIRRFEREEIIFVGVEVGVSGVKVKLRFCGEGKARLG